MTTCAGKAEPLKRVKLQPALLPAFQEFTAQVDAYLTGFTQLHHELEEWKELHNLLQDLLNSFATCRGYALSIARSEGSNQQERLVYEAGVEWRPCKRTLSKIKELACAVEWIGAPYDAATGNGPAWLLELSELSKEIDDSFSNTDLAKLPNQLSAFGDAIALWLYRADKKLRDVVQQINLLPRPASFLVHKR
jgi:hypothetical protein